MARTLTAALIAAVKAVATQTGSVSLTSQDIQARFATAAGAAGATGFTNGRTSAILTAAGTLLRANCSQAADPNTITLYRIMTPSLPASWTAAGASIATTAMATAGCCLVATGSTIRCFYINSTSKFLVYRQSTDDGVTWSAETATNAAIPTSQTVCTGIAAPNTTDVYAAWYATVQQASILERTTFTASWSAWASVGPATPLWGRLVGVSCDATNVPWVFVAGVQLRPQKSGFAAASATDNAGVWSSWTSIHDMDSPDNGLAHNYNSVHYNPADHYYYAAVNLVDSGSVSGTAQNRLVIWRSTDGINWQIQQSSSSFGLYEVHWIVISGIVYLFDNATVYSAPAPIASSDLSSDVLAIEISEQFDDHQHATITLSNESNQYNGIGNLKDNAHLLLSLGYNGSTVQTHELFIDAVEYSASPDLQTATIKARSLTKFLDQINMRLIALSSKSVSTIATQILKLANVPFSALPVTSQFTTVIPNFTIQPGESWSQALKRLGSVYDFEFLSATPLAVKIVERSSSDPVTWFYDTTTILALAWQINADQPNVVRVVGASALTTNLFAEVTDTANLLSSGAHRYEHIVDRMCDTAAKCKLKAQLSLRDDQTQAQTGAITIALNPQLELGDVISITDSRAGLTAQSTRINAITTAIDTRSGEWLQHLGLELP